MSDLIDRDRVIAITLDRIDRYFELANLKASLLLPTGAVILVAFGSLPRPEGAMETAPPAVLVALGALATTASMIASLIVVFAFTGSGAKPGKCLSVLYFGSIAQQSIDQYRERLLGIEPADFVEDILRQTHLLSRALNTKYRILNVAVGLIVLACGVLAGILLYVIAA